MPARYRCRCWWLLGSVAITGSTDDPRTVEWLANRRSRRRRHRLARLRRRGHQEAARRSSRCCAPTRPTCALTAADRVLEHLGLRTRLFAAPGWVVSPGVVKAVAAQRLSAAGRSSRRHRSGPAHHRARSRAGHRRRLSDRAVVVPDGGAVGGADRPSWRRRASRGRRPAIAQARAVAGDARRRRPGGCCTVATPTVYKWRSDKAGPSGAAPRRRLGLTSAAGQKVTVALSSGSTWKSVLVISVSRS